MSADARSRFEHARRQMLGALSDWCTTGGDLVEIGDEITSTASAMRQLHHLAMQGACASDDEHDRCDYCGCWKSHRAVRA